MKITLAFYKAKGNLSDLLIRTWTHSKYSHVEMIIKDTWVSSSPAVGGVTIQPLKELNNNWAYVDVEVDGRKLRKVLKFIKDNIDTDYDWLGLFFGNVFNSGIEDKDKFFCSEMMVYILSLFNHELVNGVVPSKTNPGELFNLFSS